MRTDSFTLKFYLAQDKKLDSGECPIYLRICINRKKVELSTKFSIENPNDWDEIIQRVKAKSPINSGLNKIEGDITNIYEELKYNKKEISASIVKDLFLGRGESVPTLTAYVDKFYRERMLGNTEISSATINNYRATIAHINSFIESTGNKKINLKQINEDFLRKLDNYLLHTTNMYNHEQTLKRNTVNKYHIKFKHILGVAISEGFIDRHPYTNYKLRMEPTTRTYLTKPELELISNNTLGGNVSLLKVRDIFMFSVYSGLRFTDAINLKSNNIEFDGKKRWIVFQQGKTKEYIRIPLLDKAEEIFDKYAEERAITGNVLPRITNQKLNAYLKVIAELVGLKKPLTHHVARHTNATTIYLANGTPLEVVSKQLGHTSIKSTQVYAKITNDMLSKAADKINKILK
ncbi:MAG TPA: site-specific integrase [Candidatus Nitrosocosmicus sp.]